MSDFTQSFAEALAELDTDETLIPGTFSWGDLVDQPCFVSGATKGGKLEEFGFGVIADVVVIVRGAMFGTDFPNRGETFTANGQEYGIDAVLKPTGTPFIRIAGVSKTRGG